MLGTYLLLLLVFNFSPLQQQVTRALERSLQRLLHTEVRIGSIDVGLFNRLSLNDVCVFDQRGDSLLRADLVSVKVEFAPFFRGKVSLRTVSLLDAQIRLYAAESDGPSNFQFLIDAFQSDTPQPDKDFHFRINSLILRRCALTYDVNDRPLTPRHFNTAHIGISGLNANISLKCLTQDSINMRVRALSFREQSGFDVQALSLRAAANRRHGEISHLKLQLPGSFFAKENLSADYELEDTVDFWSTLQVQGELDGVSVCSDDIACFLPRLRDLHQTVRLTTSFRISPRRWVFSRLGVTTDGLGLDLRSDVVIERKSGRVSGVSAEVERLRVDNRLVEELYTVFSEKEYPAELRAMSHFDYAGNVTYRPEGESRVRGRLLTGVGRLLGEVTGRDRHWTARFNLSDFDFRKIFQHPWAPEQVALTADMKADFPQAGHPDVKGDLTVTSMCLNQNTFQNIRLAGEWRGRRMSAAVTSPNALADFSVEARAQFDGQRFSDVQLEGDVRNFQPKAVGWTEYFGNAGLSAHVRMEAASVDPLNPEGTLSVRDFRMSGEQPYQLQQLSLVALPSSRGTSLKLRSDFGRIDWEGSLRFQELQQALTGWVGQCLPHTFSPATADTTGRQWKLNVQLLNSDFFTEVLHLPLAFEAPVRLEGHFAPAAQGLFVSCVAPDLKFNATELSDVRLLLRNNGPELFSRMQFNKRLRKTDLRVEMDVNTQEGKLQTELLWGGQHLYAGTLRAETAFLPDSCVSTRMYPSQVTIKDTVWQVLPGQVDWKGNAMEIRDFGIHRADQSLRLNGCLSKSSADSLSIALQKIDVQYILDLFSIDPVAFSGWATGKVNVSNTLDSLRLHADLDIPDFYFNGGLMGHANIRGAWSKADPRIYLWGDMEEENWGFTRVRGYVSPAEKGLDLRVESKNTNVHFLNRYIGSILGDMEGRTTGNCRIYGPFGALDFEGEEKVDLSTRILATGVRYHLSGGTVKMSPGRFDFDGFSMNDGALGAGQLQGALLHTHLADLRYNFRASVDNLLVYDQAQTIDMPFYATVYGTGRVGISGKPGELQADINMRPEKKTVFVYSVDSPDSFSDVQLLKLSDPTDTLRTPTAGAGEEEDEGTGSSTDIRLNFLIDMNPAADMKVVMDGKAGDHLLVHASGPIRASYYNKGRFDMFGRLNIEDGVYKMSIQDVIRKDFEFMPGSSINFTGDPYEGDLNLRAVYTVNSASLADLNIGNNLSDNSVRVNCVLNFSGKVKAPQVSFDLELPTVSEDVQQMVRNLISTEEEMNMQILYLLGVGRFYTYNYAATEAAESQSQSSVAMKSFLSNTLSSQLNNIISNAMGTSNWSFGANFSTGSVGWSDMEVEGILSGRLLDNRLIINGNFGYRDRPAYSTSTNFVGDFDVRYLITPNGGVSLKAYSATNDRYFSKSSLTTQGIGILLKRDFRNLKDLFNFRRKRKAAPADAAAGKQK